MAMAVMVVLLMPNPKPKLKPNPKPKPNPRPNPLLLPRLMPKLMPKLTMVMVDTARDLLNPKLTDTVMAMDTDMADTAVDTAAMAAMVIIMENDLPKLNLIMAVMVMADTAVVMAVMVATATVDVITDKFF